MEQYINTYTFVFGILFASLFSILFIANNEETFAMIYVLIDLFFLVLIFFKKHKMLLKLKCSACYIMIGMLQILYNSTVPFSVNGNMITSVGGRILGILLVLLPFNIEKLFILKNIVGEYLPSVQDYAVFSFHELKENSREIISILNKTGDTFSKENINTIIKDLPRHDSFRYINNGSLTDEYFEVAYKTLDDQNIYIVISNTGSATSEVISVFTKRQYNHVSLSFDRGLETIVSYNGGERIYPPGLNREMVKYLNKKEDASIIVYRLPLSIDEKKLIIDRIKEINRDGSAYNILGLVFKYSHKPNIMFCSQFVYKMLEYAGINYFKKKSETIKPTDLIELDYYRKLNFEYEIKLNSWE